MHAAAGPLNVPRRFGKHNALVAIFFFRKVDLSTDQRAAVQLLDCIQIATDIATSCWAADEAGFSIFHFRPRSSSV